MLQRLPIVGGRRFRIATSWSARIERTRQWRSDEVELLPAAWIAGALRLKTISPRVDGGRVPDYVQQVTAEQFGAMVPTATTLVGDDGGVLLGHATGGFVRLCCAT